MARHASRNVLSVICLQSFTVIQARSMGSPGHWVALVPGNGFGREDAIINYGESEWVLNGTSAHKNHLSCACRAVSHVLMIYPDTPCLRCGLVHSDIYIDLLSTYYKFTQVKKFRIILLANCSFTSSGNFWVFCSLWTTACRKIIPSTTQPINQSVSCSGNSSLWLAKKLSQLQYDLLVLLW